MIALGVSELPFDEPAGFSAPAAFGPFRVLHQIGSGVLGPVFRTFDPEQEKLVAVKVFRLDVVPEVSAHLADILRRLSRVPLDHPSVVPLLGAGLEGTTAFLAMEYVAAETLDVSLRRLAPASIETAAPMLRQVGEALEAAWAAGVGHGALHPRDVFVLPASAASSHGHAEVRVSGFGIPEALQTLRIVVPARRPYTAPEREDEGGWDIRADVYSLGVIAHELLTGRRPTGSSEQDCELPADTPLEQRIAIRRALSGALATNRAERFATPIAFVDALTTGTLPEALAETPTLPWPVEPDAEVHREGESETETEVRIEPEVDAQVQEALELDAELEPGPDVLPVASLPYWSAPEAPSARGRQPIGPPVWREPFHASIETPQENAMPRVAMAAMVVMALVVGTGFGYWLRGPATSDAGAVTSAPGGTNAPAEEPIGTDVAVTDPGGAATAQRPAAKAPPKATVEDRASTQGRLLVRSVPGGATVSVNGRNIGTTPATIRDLAFGTYTVAVSRSGYQRNEQQVTISKTVPAREVTLELAKALIPPPARGATTGSVLVETRPTGAAVSIDGKAIGTAPVRVPSLSAGSHTVRVALAGHKTVTTTVVVRPGQQTPVRVSLEIGR
ncbi:MAG: PEGA domain-containing protein [Vicinamibacterales bacterium]